MDIAKLRQLAVEAQDKSANAFHLLGGIEDTVDDLANFSDASDVGMARREEAMDRVIVFLRLAREATRLAGDAGEEIELLASTAERQRDAARKRTA